MSMHCCTHDGQSKQVQQCSGNFKRHFKSFPSRKSHGIFKLLSMRFQNCKYFDSYSLPLFLSSFWPFQAMWSDWRAVRSRLTDHGRLLSKQCCRSEGRKTQKTMAVEEDWGHWHKDIRRTDGARLWQYSLHHTQTKGGAAVPYSSVLRVNFRSTGYGLNSIALREGDREIKGWWITHRANSRQ